MTKPGEIRWLDLALGRVPVPARQQFVWPARLGWPLVEGQVLADRRLACQFDVALLAIVTCLSAWPSIPDICVPLANLAHQVATLPLPRYCPVPWVSKGMGMHGRQQSEGACGRTGGLVGQPLLCPHVAPWLRRHSGQL